MNSKAKIKIEKFNDFLHSWFLANCGFDINFELGTDFEYVYADDIVRYAFVVPSAHDELFLQVCQEISPELISCDNFLLSLFHEIGHYLTQGDFEEEVWSDYDSKLDWGNDYFGYYHHPIEYEATRSGIELMLSQAEVIPEFFVNIQKYEMEILDELGYKNFLY